MFHHTPLQQLQRRWKIILLFSVFFGAVAFGLSFLFPLEYRADAQLLLISESRYGVDPYTAAKSAERIGENLAQIVETSDFFNKVFAQGTVELDRTPYEGITEQKRRKLWQENVDASVVFGTSVLNLSAYDTDPQEAVRLSGALAQTMMAHAPEYVGGSIDMRVVNQPVATKYPVRPNMMINTLLGMFVGLFLGALLMLKK